MNRRVGLAVALLFGFMFCVPMPASAVNISRNNPYRSFNLSGVNYGSVRWEKQRLQHRSVVRQPAVNAKIRVNPYPGVLNQSRIIVRSR